MFHTLQGLMSTLLDGLTGHLEQWVGWSALIAAALFGFARSSLWMPLLVALIVNPMPFGLVAGLVHGRSPGVEGPSTYTAIQVVLAYAGFAIGRVLTRFR